MINHQQAQQILTQSEILIDQEIIEQAIEQLAQEIKHQLAHKNLSAFCIMNGGLYFAGQLLRHLDIPLTINYLHATRYIDNQGTSELSWLQKPQQNLIQDKDILLIDDIFDEGITLEAIVKSCHELGARSVNSVVLIDKLHDRKPQTGFQPEFIGLPVEDRYIFGCGMDYQGFWRNLPAIYALKDL
ncbi:MAG: hypoxanthine-guanine phosphoribosyltransferase [Kangiellaceae bacterium]|nr:hypoxanthine-guanine phosphoribosyltransferase [Kangiellaceae bacterium]